MFIIPSTTHPELKNLNEYMYIYIYIYNYTHTRTKNISERFIIGRKTFSFTFGDRLHSEKQTTVQYFQTKQISVALTSGSVHCSQI